MPSKLLVDLPADVVQYILLRIELAHHIARAAPTNKVISVAVRNAIRARGFSAEVVALVGHEDIVLAVAVAPDSRVITGSWCTRVKVWLNGACERTIHWHALRVNAVAVPPGGARFISGSEDKTAKLFNFGGELERTFKVGSPVKCVVALPDGVHFVVGLGSDFGLGQVRLYRVDGTLVHTFKGHTRAVLAVAVTPDGQHIVSGSIDKLVKVWSVASKSLVSICAGHTDYVHAVAVMPDGQRILSGSCDHDHTVRVWLLDGTLKNTFELHTDRASALVALPDNRHALSGSDDETVKLFNVDDGVVLRTFKNHTGPVWCLALLPDGRRFVSGSVDQTACVVEHGLVQ
jgi:WD40 repeat protein